VWAYVWALFAQNTLMTLALWYFEPVRIGWKWEWKYTRELIRYGAGSTLFNALNYLATKLDVLLVPRFLRAGAPELTAVQRNMASYFERASYAMTQPITVMGKLSDSVLFSGMSRMQDDNVRLQKTLCIATNLLSCVLIPATVFMAFFSDELITLWLGVDYLETAIILKVLFIGVVFRSLSKLGDSLLRAKDAVYQGSLFKAVYVVLISLGIYWGVQYSMTGVAIGLVAATFIHYIMNMHMSTRLITLSWIHLVRALFPGISLGFITLISAWFVHVTSSLVLFPGWLTLLSAIIVVPGFLIAAVYLFPTILGGATINPIHYLPERIKQKSILRNLVSRLQ
jgi:PST family polysaccharide transporter